MCVVGETHSGKCPQFEIRGGRSPFQSWKFCTENFGGRDTSFTLKGLTYLKPPRITRKFHFVHAFLSNLLSCAILSHYAREHPRIRRERQSTVCTCHRFRKLSPQSAQSPRGIPDAGESASRQSRCEGKRRKAREREEDIGRRDLPAKSLWASPRAPAESCRSRSPGRTRRTSGRTARGSRPLECLQDFTRLYHRDGNLIFEFNVVSRR